MSSITINLDPNDRKMIGEDVASRVVRRLLLGIVQAFGGSPRQVDHPSLHGIQVLRPSRVADRLEKSVRHLYRLEAKGEVPRRRRIGSRSAGYLAHELDGIDASEVQVRDRRTITLEQVAEKLDVAEKTVSRLAETKTFPRPTKKGLWYERDLDEWLLKRPKV